MPARKIDRNGDADFLDRRLKILVPSSARDGEILSQFQSLRAGRSEYPFVPPHRYGQTLRDGAGRRRV
jgi:hypothetical protein